MVRKAETGASVRVIELPVDRLAEAADLLARSFQANPNFDDLFPDGKFRARALVHVQKACLRDALGFRHVYAPIRDRGSSESQPGFRQAASRSRWATAAGRARHDSRPGRSPTVDPPPGAVHGRGEQGAPCAALLVSGGGRRRSRRAGKAVADDIKAAVESGKGESWGR
jgi:hypothetical protein